MSTIPTVSSSGVEVDDRGRKRSNTADTITIDGGDDDTITVDEGDDTITVVDKDLEPPSSSLSVTISPDKILHLALTGASILSSSVASVLTSSTFSILTKTFTPGSGDSFGIRLVCALLRVFTLLFALLRSRPFGRRLLGSVLRLLAVVAVEAALLFSQPAFSTVVGGTFKGGDALKAASARFGREAWRATQEHGGALGLVVLALGLGFLIVDKVKQKYLSLALSPVLASLEPALARLRPYLARLQPYLAYVRPTGVVTVASTVLKSAVYFHLYSFLVSTASSGYVSPKTLTMLPDLLLQSRHEISLFEWSVPSPLHRALIVVGDLLFSNPSLPPSLGLAGSVAFGTGLYLSSLTPTWGFAFPAACWCLLYLCQAAFPTESETPPLDVGVSRLAADTKTSQLGKEGASSLKLFDRSFDDVVHYSFLFALFLVRPRLLSAALLVFFLHAKKPRREHTYDRVFGALLALLLLSHLVTPSGFLQVNRVASAVAIFILGGPWMVEVFKRERGWVWRESKAGLMEGWRRAMSYARNLPRANV